MSASLWVELNKDTIALLAKSKDGVLMINQMSKATGRGLDDVVNEVDIRPTKSQQTAKIIGGWGGVSSSMCDMMQVFRPSWRETPSLSNDPGPSLVFRSP